MSFNRLNYDTCAYSKRLDESIGPLSYLLNPIKYENCKKCRHEFGLVGGTAVSHIKGNLVDLENDLRGSTRVNTLCPSKKYHSRTDNKIIIKSKCECGCGADKNIEIDTNLVNLPSCQMINYKSIPKEPKFEIKTCNCPVKQQESIPICNCEECSRVKK